MKSILAAAALIVAALLVWRGVEARGNSESSGSAAVYREGFEVVLQTGAN